MKRGRTEITPRPAVPARTLVERKNPNPPSSSIPRKPGIPTRAALTIASKKDSTEKAKPAGPSPSQIWGAKLQTLRSLIAAEEHLAEHLMEVEAQKQQEIVQGMDDNSAEIQKHKDHFTENEAFHAEALRELEVLNNTSLEEEARCLQRTENLINEKGNTVKAQEELCEQHVMEEDNFECLKDDLDAAEASAKELRDQVKAVEYQEECMKSSTFGLSEEGAAHVRRREELEQERLRLKQLLISTEMERRQKFSLYEELKGTIRVYCRVKGNVDGRDSSGARYSFKANDEGVDSGLTITQVRNNATSTGTRETTQRFDYDRVYNQRTTQGDIFEDVGPLVDTAVDGYRVCVFAYGQTGSGKTYTMEGNINDETTKGIMPRAIEKVFDRAEQLREEGWEYKVSCYFVEIYNDTIRDLLETSESYHRSFVEGRDIKRHEVKHDKESEETTLTNLHMHAVHKPADVYTLLRTAVKNRSVAKTQMNERSSRSHCVFTVKIDGVNKSINQRSSGIMCLVDLAGSERINESGVVGQQKVEAININKSLSYLGDCICALGANRVPSWRNCKLTHLLQFYLGVKGAKLLMFVTVSDKEEHSNETVNSLRFAEKVNQTSVGVAKKRVVHA